MPDLDLDELRAELEDFAQPTKATTNSAREERIIAGFEDIQRFFEEHGHAPQHGEAKDIFERIYAVRLDRLRSLEECHQLLEPLDHQGLLKPPDDNAELSPEDLDDDALLEALGGAEQEGSITDLKHVRSTAERRAAEEIANRETCKDFDQFKPLFDLVKNELETGLRSTRPFVKSSGFLKADIVKGSFYILGGQTAYVADVGEVFKAPNGETDARLRVIFSNGTESNLLRRSLQRALYNDDAGRRITEPKAGPLFAGFEEDEDQASGTIYVLRSKSDHPLVAEHRQLVHKIGITSGKVETRISNAKNDPTYLMDEVEIVATYELFNVNRTKLEKLIHRFFGEVQLNIEILDRFGKPVVPREWFLVPLAVIDEMVEKIVDGTITDFRYDETSAKIVAKTD